MDFKKDFNISKEENSQIKITGEIPYSELQTYRSAAIKTIGKSVKVDGFRTGHVPETLVVKNVGEIAVLTEMAEKAISNIYPMIVQENKLEVIGYPKIEITKIAPDNPLGFTATVAVMPEITLADYKKLAAEVNKEKSEVLVTDEDVEKQIQDILRQKAAYERLQNKAKKNSETSKETHTHADGTVHEGPDHEETEQHDEKIPDLTDELVKTLGQPGQFENVDDFKQKLREHITIEKTNLNEQRHKSALTDKIIESSKFELPQILIDSELAQMFGQMEDDIKRAGLNMDDYLSHMKKTRDDLKKEWSPIAEKRARLQLVLNEIAKKENIKPDKEALETETKKILDQHKEADPTRVKIYVSSVLQNEAVMKMLESQ